MLHIHSHYSGPVPYLHRIHPRHSGPVWMLPGPVRMLPGPVQMLPGFRNRPDIPTCFRNRPDIPTEITMWKAGPKNHGQMLKPSQKSEKRQGEVAPGQK